MERPLTNNEKRVLVETIRQRVKLNTTCVHLTHTTPDEAKHYAEDNTVLWDVAEALGITEDLVRATMEDL